jgi:hypothetical protein
LKHKSRRDDSRERARDPAPKSRDVSLIPLLSSRSFTGCLPTVWIIDIETIHASRRCRSYGRRKES